MRNFDIKTDMYQSNGYLFIKINKYTMPISAAIFSQVAPPNSGAVVSIAFLFFSGEKRGRAKNRLE
jgi:hypothetical protein